MSIGKILREVVVGSGGTLDSSTKGGCDCCDHCPAFRLLPDPDPGDWFRDGDMKAVCSKLKVVIEGGLERPSEWTNIPKPLYCPDLGRKLSKKEKKLAEEALELAKRRTR